MMLQCLGAMNAQQVYSLSIALALVGTLLFLVASFTFIGKLIQEKISIIFYFVSIFIMALSLLLYLQQRDAPNGYYPKSTERKIQ